MVDYVTWLFSYVFVVIVVKGFKYLRDVKLLLIFLAEHVNVTKNSHSIPFLHTKPRIDCNIV
jgi:hypothetical protein